MSPHTWGCSSGSRESIMAAVVVPTYVGVFHVIFRRRCGGKQLSPHTWGCSSRWMSASWARCVVPTYVGVFLRIPCQAAEWGRCPHIRGGVPQQHGPFRGHGPLSPHTWGCSEINPGAVPLGIVVPTYVGVFLFFYFPAVVADRCPHIRGGVPTTYPAFCCSHTLSPHTWGCSSALATEYSTASVVPTYVGVFL